MKILDVAVEEFKSGLTMAVFDHIRNLTICSLIFAAGTYAMRNPTEVFLGSLFGRFTGLLVVVVAGLLTLLNLSDGIYRLSRRKYYLLLDLLLIGLYVLLTLRVTELVWGLRSTVI